MQELRGTVTWFDWRKGFGFIAPDDLLENAPSPPPGSPLGQEFFVLHEDIERDGFKTLSTGERVTFRIKSGDGGLKAEFVRPLVG